MRSRRTVEMLRREGVEESRRQTPDDSAVQLVFECAVRWKRRVTGVGEDLENGQQSHLHRWIDRLLGGENQ